MAGNSQDRHKSLVGQGLTSILVLHTGGPGYNSDGRQDFVDFSGCSVSGQACPPAAKQAAKGHTAKTASLAGSSNLQRSPHVLLVQRNRFSALLRGIAGQAGRDRPNLSPTRASEPRRQGTRPCIAGTSFDIRRSLYCSWAWRLPVRGRKPPRPPSSEPARPNS